MVARGLLHNPGLFAGRLEGMRFLCKVFELFYSATVLFLYEINEVLFTGQVETWRETRNIDFK